MEGDFRLAHPVPARLSQAYTPAAGRKFGFTVGLALAALTGIGLWRGHQVAPIVLGTLSGALLLAALAIPTKLQSVEQGWMKFAHLLSKVTTPIFMGVVYFVVLTPVGVVRRALGGNALVHRVNASGSTWMDRAGSPPSALDRLF